MEASSPSLPDILLFSALAQTNPNIICIYLSKRYWWLLMCIQLGKMNKRQAVCPVIYHTWVPREGKTPQRCHSFPRIPRGTDHLPGEANEELLSPPGDNMSAVFTNLRMFPCLCCQCPQSRENQGWPSCVPGFQQEFKLQFIREISYLMKQKLCWFFILIQKIPLSRDSCYVTKLCS